MYDFKPYILGKFGKETFEEFYAKLLEEYGRRN